MDVLDGRSVVSLSDHELIPALDALDADIIRRQDIRLQLIARIENTGHAQELGARDAVELVSLRYRRDRAEVWRDVRLARALPRYTAVNTALTHGIEIHTQPNTHHTNTHHTNTHDTNTHDTNTHDTNTHETQDTEDTAALDTEAKDTEPLDAEALDSGAHDSGDEGVRMVRPMQTAHAVAIVSELERVRTRVPVDDLDIAEEQLVQLAAHLSPAELRTAAKEICNLLDSDGPEPDERKAYERESLTLTNADKGVKFKGYLANENAELLRAVVHAGARPHKTTDGEHDPRPRDKRQADALSTALTIAATAWDTNTATPPSPTAEANAARSGPRPTAGTGAEPTARSTAGTGAESGARSTAGTGAESGVWSTAATGAESGAWSTAAAGAESSSGSGAGAGSSLGAWSTAGSGAGASSAGSSAGCSAGSGTGAGCSGGTDAASDAGASAAAPDAGGSAAAPAASPFGASTSGASTSGVSISGVSTTGATAISAAGGAVDGSAVAAGGDGTGAGKRGRVPGYGAKACITVTIDLQDLKAATADAIGQTVYGDGLSAAIIRRLACDAKVIPIVLGSNSEPLDVGRCERLVTKGMRFTLNARDRGCVVCGAPPIMCDAHHLTSWIDGGETKVDNLALLCRRHHTDLHNGRWTITITNGVVHVARPTWADPPPLRWPSGDLHRPPDHAPRETEPPRGNPARPNPAGDLHRSPGDLHGSPGDGRRSPDQTTRDLEAPRGARAYLNPPGGTRTPTGEAGEPAPAGDPWGGTALPAATTGGVRTGRWKADAETYAEAARFAVWGAIATNESDAGPPSFATI